jgi:hypothetical protein
MQSAEKIISKIKYDDTRRDPHRNIEYIERNEHTIRIPIEPDKIE